MSALQVTPIAAATVTPAEQISASGGFRKIVSEPEKLFTLEQVQAAGNFSRSTLYRLRHGGGLRTITIGGVTRVRERDWQAWLDKHAAGTGEIAP
jgi:Helix-turn-helix domain